MNLSCHGGSGGLWARDCGVDGKVLVMGMLMVMVVVVVVVMVVALLVVVVLMVGC